MIGRSGVRETQYKEISRKKEIILDKYRMV